MPIAGSILPSERRDDFGVKYEPPQRVKTLERQEKGKSDDHHNSDRVHCSRSHGGYFRSSTIVHNL